jgi:hypothetical protein
MTPKLKAAELIEKYKRHAYPPDDIPVGSEDYYAAETRIAKSCAIICVDEILEELPGQEVGLVEGRPFIHDNYRITYWESVKEELLKQS